MKNTAIIALSFILALSLSSLANALEKMPYSAAAFDKSQADGDTVLIDVYASWCPTCERQQLIIDAYLKQQPQSQIKVMVVDYDNDKTAVKRFKAPRQSTLSIYRNHQQRYFSVAETRRRIIHQALRDNDPALSATAAE